MRWHILVQVGGTASCYTVSGAVDGTVCLWNGHTLSESQRVHTTAVSAITTLPPPEGTTGDTHCTEHIVKAASMFRIILYAAILLST
jgi:hypothetical protein